MTTDIEIADLLPDADAPHGQAAYLAELAAEADAALAGVEVAELIETRPMGEWSEMFGQRLQASN